MPSSDLVLNVRQVAGYPLGPVDGITVLLGQRGLGGPYVSMCPSDIVSTALATGGDMAIGGGLAAQSIQAGLAQFTSLSSALVTAGQFGAQNANVTQLNVDWLELAGQPVATTAYVDNAIAAAVTVRSVNARRGDVMLGVSDIFGAAPLLSPRFEGAPSAQTPSPASHSSRLATTAFVHRNSVEYISKLLACHPFVFSFQGRTGEVKLTMDDLVGADGALIQSPNFEGTPTAPTPPAGDNSTQIANTKWVNNAIASAINNFQSAIDGLSDIYAPIHSPVFTGFPSGPTAPQGASTGQLATTAFVMNAIQDSTTGVVSFNTRIGTVTLQSSDISAAGGALLAGPVFTGTPQAPTAAPGNSTAQIATTAFVQAALSATATGVSSFNGRTGAVALTLADVTLVGGAPLNAPAFTGIPTAPTAAAGTSTAQIATTAFVEQAISGATAGVASFNGRTGAVTLTSSDISAAGGAILNSPAFVGTPTAPTASAGTSTTQIATTAFVAAKLTGFADSLSLTGVPTAPTAAPGTNTNQLATTAFVEAAVAAATAGVATFNGRTGDVLLQLSDVTGVGGAPLASPALTGSPTAPTAAAGTSTTQLATTAFVQAAIAAAGGGVTSFNSRTGAVTLTGPDISAAGGALTSAIPVASNGNPLVEGTADPGTSPQFSRADHVHPSAAQSAPPQIVSAAWLAGSNPNGVTVFIAPRALTILSLVGVADALNGAAATVSVVKAANGQALSAGTAIHSGAFDGNANVAVNQTLTLTTTTMNAGDRLGLVATGTFTNSVGSITVTVQ